MKQLTLPREGFLNRTILFNSNRQSGQCLKFRPHVCYWNEWTGYLILFELIRKRAQSISKIRLPPFPRFRKDFIFSREKASFAPLFSFLALKFSHSGQNLQPSFRPLFHLALSPVSSSSCNLEGWNTFWDFGEIDVQFGWIINTFSFEERVKKRYF